MDPAYAERYSALYRDHWWWRAREEAVILELRRRVPASGWGRILDVGCGDGLLFPRLEEFGQVYGVEPTAALRAPAGRYAGRIHPGPLETFRTATGFGLILMLDVLEHLADPEAALRQALALLDPAGTLLITVPAFRMLWTTHDALNQHITRYTKRTFRSVADRAGMRVDAMRYFFHWLFFAKLGVRLYESIVRPEPRPPRVPPRGINRAAYLLARAEDRLLGRLPVPLGSSLLAVGGRQATR